MLIRICLIAAILASLAVGIANFVFVKDKITALGNDRDKEKQLKVDTMDKLAKTNAVLVKVNADLTKTKAELTSTISARDAAMAKADEQSKRADGLAGELKTTSEKLSVTSDKLAQWDSLGIPISTARETLTSLKKVEEQMNALAVEKGVIYGEYRKVDAKLRGILGEYKDLGPPLPDDLHGKVLAVDPKYNFVVLDVGEKQGALEAGKLLISRNGVLVGEVVITASIDSNRCVANVVAPWDESNIHEGDMVIAANIAK